MSKSLKRVRAALLAAHLPDTIAEVGQARTAQDAADSIGCAVDQIVKSMLFAHADAPDRLVLFLTAGGQQVDTAKATALAGQPLTRAEGARVRAVTGFAVGGVAPLGHLTALPVFMDSRLSGFATVWAAAGTPRHVFSIPPDQLRNATGAQVAPFTTSDP